MDLKLMQRLLPYAAIAIVTAFSLWFRRSSRCTGKSERSSDAEDDEGTEVSSGGGSEFEVFLSFRGEDTRNGFTGHLYDSLQEERGVSTFIDSYKLEKGEKIDKLLEYIDKSKICILIISKRYAESKWCLKEVTKCLECNKEIIPVFFGVEPSDVRNQSGPFKYAFKRHESNKKLKPEEVRKWREALMKVGDTSGFNLKDMNGDEVKLKRAVIERILSKVNKKRLEVAKHPVGLEKRVEHVKKIIDNCGHEVHVVGIHGMGGLGKTTIAKNVYNDLAKKFDSATCFLSNIRDKSESPNGLVDLQKQLIGDILKEKNISSSDVSGGQSLMKDRAKSKKVLLVLDDVDSAEQLDALAGGRDWFGSGSVIIITTRDKKVLVAHKVKEEEIYKPQMLDEAESLKLFFGHAFDGVQPQGEYDQLAREIVAAAGGLPLTIKVLGSLLSCINDVGEWKAILEKVKKVPRKEVQQTLKISYDSLSNYEKEIFHIFLLVGTDVMPLTCGRNHPKTAIPVLEQRSLITINEETEEFEMHDQIRDMGREIVGGESSEAPEKDTRFPWWARDFLDLLRRGIVETKDAEAIEVTGRWNMNDPLSVDIGCFADMSRLRMLQLFNVTLKGECERFPKNIRWLEWRRGDLKCLPSCLHLDNVAVLDLSWSSIVRLWDGQKDLHKLKTLRLNYCESITKSPHFTSNLTDLQELDFSDCVNMAEVDPSIQHLKALTRLSFNNCKSLKELPEEAFQLTSLQLLDLSGCSSLRELPESICLLLHLERLNVSGCESLVALPNSIGQLEILRNLDLSRTGVNELPDSIFSLNQLYFLSVDCCDGLKFLLQLPPSLVILSAEHCTEMVRINGVSFSEGLQELRLTGCGKLVDIPSIKQSTGLRKLMLEGCTSLGDSFLEAFEVLDELQTLHLRNCESLTKSPRFTCNKTRWQELDFSGCVKMAEVDPSICHLKALTRLNLSNCESLKEVPESICLLLHLRVLNASGCTSLASLPNSLGNLKSLTELNAWGCTSLASLPNSLGNLKRLRKLELRETAIEQLPDSIIQLENLRDLSVVRCNNLRFLPPLPPSVTSLDASGCRNLGDILGIERLTGLQRLSFGGCLDNSFLERLEVLHELQTLHLGNCESLTKSPHFTRNMTDLRELDFSDCVNMAEVDPSIQRLKALTRLRLNNCKSLKELPEEVFQLTSLKQLHIRGSSSLKSLPNSLGNLKRLRELQLRETAIEQLPDSILQLENLDYLSVVRCNNLRFLPPLPPSVTSLNARGCGKLLDITGLEQMTGLEGLFLDGRMKLLDSLLERVESILINSKRLKYFGIPGRLMEGGSSYPQSLSFPLPKHLKNTVLYLYVDESSVDNIKTKIEDRSEEESMGYVARLLFSINDVQFSFSASFDYRGYQDIPTARFMYEEVMKKMAEADVDGTGIMKMHVSVRGCTLLHAHLFSLYLDDRVDLDEIDDMKRELHESLDNVVKVRFY